MKLPSVLIIYTGGTFGMDARSATSSGSLSLPEINPEKLRTRFLERVPELTELARCKVDIAFNRDSAHMGPSEWTELADRIRKKAPQFDGIVILHGTDTLPYTASALSFLLNPCPVPVIITGAQRPLAALRTDARRNLVSAVEIAARGPRPGMNQVAVFFDDRLMQGNRTRKRSAYEFGAFESPQAPPLAFVGTSIRYSEAVRLKKAAQKRSTKLLSLDPRFDSKVLLMHVTPGFPSQMVRENLLKELSALLLIIFPSGTAPTHDPEFLMLLREARARQIPVILVTEGVSPASDPVPGQGVNPSTYEAGRPLLEEGAIWAGSMTPECAYVKASLLLGQRDGKRVFDRYFLRNLADEGASAAS